MRRACITLVCLPACTPLRLTPRLISQSREDSIQQSGFQQLYEIELGQAPTCSVCQEGCGYDQKPTYMRCAHFACEVTRIRLSTSHVRSVSPARSHVEDKMFLSGPVSDLNVSIPYAAACGPCGFVASFSGRGQF